jgi:DHA1 family tetracycline resistance protein-like MFS transporter
MNESVSTPTETSVSPNGPIPTRSAMITVFLVVFIDLLGFGIVLPLLPRYADVFLPLGTPSWVKGVVTGLILSVFSAMQFIFAPIWGRISDRVGRRPILLIGLSGSVIFYGAFGIVSDLFRDGGWLVLILIFFTRVGAGICGATISTAAAVIADCTTKEKRAHGMALIGAAFGIGFTFGPLIAYGALQILGKYPGAPGYAAAFLSFIALFIAWKKMPETRRPDGTEQKRGWLDIKSLYSTLQTPTVGLLVLIFFLATFGFANFEGTLSVLTLRAFGLSDADNFLVFAYVGFCLVLAQGYFYRKFVKKLDEVTLMRIGLTCMLLGLANLGGIAYFASNATTSSPTFYWFLITLAICVFGFAFLNPSVNGLISKRSDPNRQGEVLGVNQSFSALARILGPIAGLSLFYLDDSTRILPYLLASGLLFVVLLLLPKIRHQEPITS